MIELDHVAAPPAGRRRTFAGPGCALDGRLDELIAGGVRAAVQQMVLEHDWSATPLGDESEWSPPLRTAVSTVLNSRFGMVLWQLRSAIRALLLESDSPAHVLGALDRFAALVPGAACSTVFCAVIDPQGGSLRYSSAGQCRRSSSTRTAPPGS